MSYKGKDKKENIPASKTSPDFKKVKEGGMASETVLRYPTKTKGPEKNA